MLKDYLKRLMLGGDLTEAEMHGAVSEIMSGEAPPVVVGAFLVALHLKGETVAELTGAVRAMRDHMTPIAVDGAAPLIDVCGTGGDGAGTFNISTAVSFVAAAGGAKVAKHGNRAISSRSGSADVLAALGVDIDAPPAVVARCVDEVGLGFLFAPNLHPAMKHVGAVRRALGVRTMFNLLGPLTNPASVRRQLLGVFHRSWVRPLCEVLGRLGAERVWIVHGHDGLDELSVCGPSQVAEWRDGEVAERTVRPEDVGLPVHAPEGLHGGSPEENARILREVLAGERPGPIADAVALNAGAAFVVADLATSLAEGVGRARALLQSGAPAALLDRLVAASRAG